MAMFTGRHFQSGEHRGGGFDSGSLSSEVERTSIACLPPIGRPNVADPGEHLVGHRIDERIDLAHIYAAIWKMPSRLTSS